MGAQAHFGLKNAQHPSDAMHLAPDPQQRLAVIREHIPKKECCRRNDADRVAHDQSVRSENESLVTDSFADSCTCRIIPIRERTTVMGRRAADFMQLRRGVAVGGAMAFPLNASHSRRR